MKIRIAGIVKNSIVDGSGLRYVIFGQGCSLNCEDCHNPHTHDPNGGELVEISAIAEEIKKDPLLDGVTFSGGEPFMQVKEFAKLAELVDIHIMCYSGYTFEELYQKPETHTLLSKIDLLVDGRFDREQKNFSRFKGSENQRIIDSKESVKCGKAIEVDL